MFQTFHVVTARMKGKTKALSEPAIGTMTQKKKTLTSHLARGPLVCQEVGR